MSPPDDLGVDMSRFDLDPASIDRLLAGEIHPDDAPPGLGHVAALTRAANGPALPGELVAKDAAVAALVATGGSSLGLAATSRRRSMLGKFLTLKALALGVPVALCSAGVAAAATDSLPAPAQSAVSHALSHLGIDLPDGSTTTTTSGTTDTGTNHASTAKGPDAGPTSPATFGLCTAYTNGGLNTHGVAYANLVKAAAAAGSTDVGAYCSGILSSASGSTNDSTTTTTSGSSAPDVAPHSGTAPSGPPTSGDVSSGGPQTPDGSGSGHSSGNGSGNGHGD